MILTEATNNDIVVYTIELVVIARSIKLDDINGLLKQFYFIVMNLISNVYVCT